MADVKREANVPALKTAAERQSGLHALAVLYLAVQGVAVLAWWALLLTFPAARSPFIVEGAPAPTLLAFLPGDLFLYAGGSFLAAYGLWRNRPWTWSVLCVLGGAVAYAAFYGVSLTLFSGGEAPGALLMVPSALLLSFFVWKLRPGGSA